MVRIKQRDPKFQADNCVPKPYERSRARASREDSQNEYVDETEPEDEEPDLVLSEGEKKQLRETNKKLLADDSSDYDSDKPAEEDVVDNDTLEAIAAIQARGEFRENTRRAISRQKDIINKHYTLIKEGLTSAKDKEIEASDRAAMEEEDKYTKMIKCRLGDFIKKRDAQGRLMLDSKGEPIYEQLTGRAEISKVDCYCEICRKRRANDISPVKSTLRSGRDIDGK